MHIPFKYSHFLLILAGFVSNVNSAFVLSNEKKYSITYYRTNVDTYTGRVCVRFKECYSEYNSDSNVIYEERYSENKNIEEGFKLAEKSTTTYNGKYITETKREWGMDYEDEDSRFVTYSYIYEDSNHLVKYYCDKELMTISIYDHQNHLIEEKYPTKSGKTYYRKYFYNKGLRTKWIDYDSNTVTRLAKFRYDKNKKLVERFIFNEKNVMVFHEVIKRNNKGLAIEAKERTDYTLYRLYRNGRLVEDEFHQKTKYYYNEKEQLIKIESYDIGHLKTVYEIEYQFFP